MSLPITRTLRRVRARPTMNSTSTAGATDLPRFVGMSRSVAGTAGHLLKKEPTLLSGAEWQALRRADERYERERGGRDEQRPMGGIRLLRPPGVYRAQADTWLLVDVMRAGGYARGATALDLCTGTGAVAMAAVAAGAREVTATDLSWRSVSAAWCNSRLRGMRVQVRQGDLFAPVNGRRFDLVLANPPYVPCAQVGLPRHRMGRCWDAGVDGRALLDRMCDQVEAHLSDVGVALVIHSALCDEQQTLRRLTDQGLSARVLANATIPFGPVMTRRAGLLENLGLIEPGQRHERLVAIGASRPGPDVDDLAVSSEPFRAKRPA
ncbi:MAG: HemK2/MTQ2 family protein methyltransferase [Pseudonocardia sp.]